MSGWLEALFGKAFSSGVSIPLSKGLNFTGGLAASTNQSTKQIDVVAAPTQANANTLAPLLRGVGLTVDANGRLAARPRLRSPYWRDMFCTGGITSGTIGDLGWTLLGSGTPAYLRASVNGGLSQTGGQLNTSASSGDWSALAFGDNATRPIAIPGDIDTMQFSGVPSVSLADRRFFIGLISDLSVDPTTATNAIGIGFDSGVLSGRWFALVRSSSVGSPVDLGVSPNTSSRELITVWQRTPGAYEFYVGGSLRGAISSGVPTATMALGIRIQTLTTAAIQQRLSAFQLTSALAGALDDDAFLEV